VKTKLCLSDIDVAGKRCLVRVDFNVPLDEFQKITDDTRIRAALPTINDLIDRGAKIILMSHLGRPKGERNPKLSLKHVLERLSRLLNHEVKFVDDCVGEKAEKAVAELKNSEKLLLENLRFNAEETKNDPAFAEKLARHADIFVNDAFGTAHRAHASTEGITHYVEKSVCGFLMRKEIDYFNKSVSDPIHPVVAIVGGAKVSTKTRVLSSLIDKVDKLIVGGGLAFTFLLAPWGSAATVVLTLGLTLAASPALRRPVMALTVLGASVALVGPAGGALAELSWEWSRRPGSLEAWKETRAQRLEMAGGEPKTLYADGRLLAVWPDPWSTAPRAHLLMLLHPAPRRVLLVGGFADGTVATVADHVLRLPGGRLDVVPTDPGMVEVLPRWYGEPFRGQVSRDGLVVHATDPLRVIQGGGPWDMIVLLDPDPSTLRQNRTRTLEFFRRCRERLDRGGLLVLRVGVPDTYLGGVAGRLLRVLAATLDRVFPRLEAIPGESVFLVAGGGETDPVPAAEVLEGR